MASVNSPANVSSWMSMHIHGYTFLRMGSQGNVA